MNRSFKLSNGKFLNLFDVNKTTVKETPSSTHHIWIRDRSGSMYSELPKLNADIFDRIKTLPVGDIVSLGWFSGRDQFGWDVTAFKITSNEDDFKFLKNLISKNNHGLGLTCYTDILIDAKKSVVEKYNTLLENFSLMFFTDGYPNVGATSEIFNAARELSPLVNSALIVGYGNYYNKELLLQLAETVGGTLTHSANLGDFAIHLSNFVESTKNTDKKLSVTFPHTDTSYLFSVNRSGLSGSVNTYQLENGKVLFSPSKNKTDVLYSVSQTPHVPFPIDSAEFSKEKLKNRKNALNPVITGLYAYAHLLVKQGKMDEALAVVGSDLGDVKIVDQITTAFTPDEYGVVETALINSAVTPSMRISGDFNRNYLPKDDAFCVLDLLEALTSTPGVSFYPRYAGWEYKRTGAGSKPAEGMPTFKMQDNVSVPFNKLTWASDRLNLSILARIPGKVKFNNPDYAKYGFAEEYPSAVYRNYTLIKDGFLNVDNIFINVTKDAQIKLLLTSIPDSVFETFINPANNSLDFKVNLKTIPVMNRAMGKQYNSASELFDNAWTEMGLAYNQKYLNYLYDELTKDEEPVRTVLTAEQQAFLESQGISERGFNPKTTPNETTDFYKATEFSIKIKGFSSVPSIKSVKEKMDKVKNWDKKGKEPKYTQPEEIMVQVIADYDRMVNPYNKEAKVKVLETLIELNKAELAKVRSKIQKAKFAVIVGKNWFKEFPSRNETTMTKKIDGKDITFELSVREVDIPY